MRLALEAARGDLRVRVVECDCEVPPTPCDTRWLIVGSESDLWLAVVCTTEADVPRDVAAFMEDKEYRERRGSEIVLHGLAVYGLPWEDVSRSSDRCMEQFLAWFRAPDWIERVPTEQVLRLRGWVSGGDPLRRVESALRLCRGRGMVDD